MILFEDNHAVFSPCGQYRYALWRKWDKKPYVMFIGLNPSTANASNDDPTIRRVRSIAKNLGYGGFYMMNLFAIVSPYPEVLKSHPDPIGANNDWLAKYANECEDIIFAWGNFKEAEQRAKEVAATFKNAKALFINKNGSPKHPLYCRSDIKPVLFNSEQKDERSVATEVQ